MIQNFQRSYVKKLLLKLMQNWQENTYLGVSFYQSCRASEIFNNTILKNICKLLLSHLRYYTPANNTTEALAKSEADLGLLQYPAIS